MQLQSPPNVTIALDETGAYPMVNVTADAAMFSASLWQLGNRLAGEHGAGIHFYLRGDAKLIRRISGRDPRITAA